VKKITLVVAIILISGFNLQSFAGEDSSTNITYRINVTNYQDDLFHITVLTENLTPENNIYNFVSTAPGTYTVLDIGRFVKSFTAYDSEGNELVSNNISTNQWQIENVDRLSKIIYNIEDSYDAQIEEHQIALMCGTGIQEGYIVLNTFGVLGYFEGLQSNPVKLQVDYKSDWTIGTAMDIDSEGYYYAETYDRLADSPILIGELTSTSTKVNDIAVDIFVYNQDSTIFAEDILSVAEDVLESAGEIMEYSPVPYYKFLMVFMDYATYSEYAPVFGGALEHSYSSLYVLPYSKDELTEARNTMAHEFMHILTPLHLHSEIIHTYNFVKPTASEHIWLYEGVTEWFSDIMQLRSGLITHDKYLNEISIKLQINDMFNPFMSLSDMSLKVYDDEVIQQFYNFYCRGAVTAALLDIRLLELSNGSRGLRELFLELLKEYGKDKPFPEDSLFDIIVDKTYPEIEQFINDYIRDSKPLPIKEYMYKLGINYTEEKPSEDKRPMFGITQRPNEDGMSEIIDPGRAYQYGLRSGDIILKILGREVNLETFRSIADSAYTMSVGDEFDLVVKRGDQEIELTGILFKRKSYHVFESIEELIPEQKFLRDRWLKNL
jgi:predicted metalloprotease with PDZ domain